MKLIKDQTVTLEQLAKEGIKHKGFFADSMIYGIGQDRYLLGGTERKEVLRVEMVYSVDGVLR